MEHYLYCPKGHGQFGDWVEVCPQCRRHLVHEPPPPWFTKTHITGIVFGGLTLFAGGVGIIPEGIIGVLQRSPVNTDHLMGCSFAMALVVFVSALLCSPDHLYRRFWIVICAGAAIAAIGGVALIVAAYRYPAFKEPTLGASFYGALAFLAGLWALTDSAVLCIRLLWAWWARKGAT